ncbi:hypothetical protein SOASR030_27350 [Leminorella grimontii]|uniref:YD repeat-containing protein n=1 Tax=Leminorella grimontii TaxID=82981 RepID=A0AAV5N3F9_9GAMM|nr:hypothetical protein GLGR_2643 [Leminorella grimontii ATCC 33999 = DSM 5078]GKX56623.1 hypothetical protein SOASR030_27350 [Leminorella grimontii]GKX59776.1 hypothetical protein SOASR031_20910 [Leminorella grimontii]
MRAFFTHYFLLICLFAFSCLSYASTPLSSKDKAIFSFNLALTENSAHAFSPAPLRVKKLKEVTFRNGERIISSEIDYSPEGDVVRVKRREKNRRGESVTYVYKDSQGWVKSINWIINGQLSSVGNVVVRYQQDGQGRIVKSELMNSGWMRQFIYNIEGQLTEVIEKSQVEKEYSEGYTVKRYHYNPNGLLARSDSLSRDSSYESSYYFDYNENNILQRIIAEAKFYAKHKRRSEKHYSRYDHHANWLHAEWGPQENRFTQERTIDYYGA